MAHVHAVQFVRPVCALTWTPEIAIDEVVARLETVLGPVDARSAVYAFDFTRFYEGEMGSSLSKCFAASARLIHPGALAGLKNATNGLERQWMADGLRRVNLDPGYVAPSKLVVASAKDFSHRIYVGQGIYADLQLQFRQGRFWPHPWTFPDYRTEEALAFFKTVRDELYHRIKHEANQL